MTKSPLTPEQLQTFAHMGGSLFTAIGAALSRLAEISTPDCPATPDELAGIVLGNAGLNAFLELVRDMAPEAEADALEQPAEH